MKFIDITDKPPASEVADALLTEMADYSKPTFKQPIEEFGRKNSNYVPTGYDDLYRYYFVDNDALCRKIVKKFVRFADRDEVEELVHDVFVRCIKKDVLKLHNPEKGNFGAIIFFVTRTICVNYLDKKGRDPMSNVLRGKFAPFRILLGEESNVLADASLYYEEDNDEILELNAVEFERSDENTLEPTLIAKLTVEELYKYMHVRSHKHTSMMDRKLSQLLTLMLQEKTVKECAKILGIGKSTTYKLIKLLQMVCKDFIR